MQQTETQMGTTLRQRKCHETTRHCPTALHMKLFCTVQRLGHRSAPQPSHDKTGKHCTAPHVQTSLFETNLLACDGDLVRLASGFGFYVRGTTSVHVLELYAVMGGMYAPERREKGAPHKKEKGQGERVKAARHIRRRVKSSTTLARFGLL